MYSKASRKPKKAMQDPHKMLKIEICEFFTKSEKIRKSQVLLEPIQNRASPRSAHLEAVYLKALL